MLPVRYSQQHFFLFRVLLGAYFAVYLVALLPYASEIFGAESFLVSGERGGFVLRRVFPNLLESSVVGTHPEVFLLAMLGLAVSFAAGRVRRGAAVGLWYGLACLLNRNPAVMNPSHAFIGWLCLASAIVPSGESWRQSSSNKDWAMPEILFWGGWLVMAAGYSASGVAKLKSAGWLDGSAFSMTLDMAYVRATPLRAIMLAMPSVFLRLGTWLVLGVELLFAPLALFAATRRLAWYAAVGLHCGLLVLFDFPEISVGMLLLHVFTYDERWSPPWPWVAAVPTVSSQS